MEILRCDRCGAEGAAPYLVIFDRDGEKEFVLCPKHNGRLEQLRDLSYGTWHDAKSKRKRGIQKVKLEDIT